MAADLSSLSALAPQVSLAGFAMYILWKMSTMFVNREREKDKAHAEERAEWATRLDHREGAMRTLESDIRNTFSASLTENSNVVKQALAYMARRAKRPDIPKRNR